MIAAGAGKIEKGERIPLDVKVGDRVLFGKYSGTEIKVEDEDYLILREDEIAVRNCPAQPRLLAARSNDAI